MHTAIQHHRRRAFRLLACLVLSAAISAGCSTTGDRQSAVYTVGLLRPSAKVKPVVAVMDFENKAGFTGQWNLGNGMADVLNAALLESSRVIVLERQYLKDVIDELNLQGNDLFRPEGRVERGRLMNAQYLIRGAVTDFTVTDDNTGWFSSGAVKLRGGSSRARVSIALRVYEVASGEVISTVKTDADAKAGLFGGTINYRDVAFGGDSYFRTPLGRATEEAIARAVKKILVDLPARPWKPQIAEAQGERAVLNGGRNTGIRSGQTYLIRDSGRPVTDPATGHVLDTVPGGVLGKLTVVDVTETTATARIIEGSGARGNHLELIRP